VKRHSYDWENFIVVVIAVLIAFVVIMLSAP
jgi:hypothetical protein